jgi:hypothetical protein
MFLVEQRLETLAATESVQSQRITKFDSRITFDFYSTKSTIGIISQAPLESSGFSS